MNWGAAGWLLIAGIVVVASVGLHRSTRVAQRFLARHVTGDATLHPATAVPAPAPVE
jgi:hypothetical protein